MATTDLTQEIGNKFFYYDKFNEYNKVEANKFLDFITHRSRGSDNHEQAIQYFLRMSGQRDIPWRTIKQGTTTGVQATPVLKMDEGKHFCLVRLRPGALKSETICPPGFDMRFHVLLGRAIIVDSHYRTRFVTRGHSCNIKGGLTYSIKCLNEDHACLMLCVIGPPILRSSTIWLS